MKKILILSLFLCITGCAETENIEKVTTKICKSTITENVGTIWSFDLNSDNEILSATVETHISPEYLTYKHNTSDISSIYSQTKDAFISEYNILEKDTEIKKWFTANIEGNDKDKKLSTKYSFVFTDKSFSIKLNDYFLESFGLMKLYDSKSDKLVYSTNITSTLFTSEAKAECK